MKNLYHLCITAHDEVLIRNEEDARQLINLSALAAHRTDTDILTDSDMSSHLHFNLNADRPDRFSFFAMESITKDFNRRHNRRGRLFDKNPFMVKLEGAYHIQMSLCYGLRQGMHHGICQTPYEYPWSTCNYLFRKERGLPPEKAMYDAHDLKSILPEAASFPEEWTADENGILTRSSFENLSLVQTWFGTARSYMFSMTRKTSEEWLKEQDSDNAPGPRVTLALLEQGFSSQEISQMLLNEGNAKYLQRKDTDMTICKIIDENMLGRFHAKSVYGLDVCQKLKIIDELRYDGKYSNIKQLARCVALKY